MLEGASIIAVCMTLAELLTCAVGQVVHGYLRIMHSSPRSRPTVGAHETALLLHLLLTATIAFKCLCGDNEQMRFIAADIPIAPLMWANVGIAAICLYGALMSSADEEMPEELIGFSWMSLCEIALALLCTPLAFQLLGRSWEYVLYADAAYFLFRTSYLLLVDQQVGQRVISPLSIAEALKRLPEGILYADAQGRPLIANDTMRRCLAELDMGLGLPQIEDLWNRLNERAISSNAVNVPTSIALVPESWVLLRVNANEVRLFSFEGAGFDQEQRYPSGSPLATDAAHMETSKQLIGGEPHIRVLAFDMTEEIAILEEIERTNEKLAASQAELRASMKTVQEAAENEAMLRMRGRVHDVIGQRLSMLHRALEDDALSDEQLDQLKPLLNGILDDLASGSHIEPADELAATIEAFALTGVAVRFEGALPDDARQAKLIVDCIREGATNAVKHAHATLITAAFSDGELTISNDGDMPEEPITEGTGLANMRRGVESDGGTFEIEAGEPPFTLRITL